MPDVNHQWTRDRVRLANLSSILLGLPAQPLMPVARPRKGWAPKNEKGRKKWFNLIETVPNSIFFVTIEFVLNSIFFILI